MLITFDSPPATQWLHNPACFLHGVGFLVSKRTWVQIWEDFRIMSTTYDSVGSVSLNFGRQDFTVLAISLSLELTLWSSCYICYYDELKKKKKNLIVCPPVVFSRLCVRKSCQELSVFSDVKPAGEMTLWVWSAIPPPPRTETFLAVKTYPRAKFILWFCGGNMLSF